MKKKIGYFEGTDSALLSALVCAGYDTMPVSNGIDNHGQNARLINDENRYDLLITYLHKIYTSEEQEYTVVTFRDLFHTCCTYSIPVIIEVLEPLQKEARRLLGDPPDIVRFVDPGDTLMVANQLLRNVQQPARGAMEETQASQCAHLNREIV